MSDLADESALPSRQLIADTRDLLHDCTKIVSFTGAGLSAESGVSTFRDAHNRGLWDNHDPTRLASQIGFADDAELVMRWYGERRRQIATAEPNAAHRALAARPDITHVTQNVDDLLHRAGAKQVAQLHGTIAVDRCNAACGFAEPVELRNPPGLRPCPACGDRLRPGVVWFGESLPTDVWNDAERACAECDALLVVGTSAVVYPAAGLIALAHRNGAAIVVVNTERSGASALADIELIGPAGELVSALLAADDYADDRIESS